MAEASLDQSEMSEDNQCESIVTFVEKNSSNEKIKELYDAWESLCVNLQIDLTYVRWKLDSWFQDCYHASQDIRKLSEVSPEMAQRRKEDLYEQFMTEIKMVIEAHKENFINKVKIEAAKDEVYRNYHHNPEDWVDKAIECVEKEMELVANFKKVFEEFTIFKIQCLN
ncbi:uncharacterized protein LOC128546065 [Mercenaria mercenaria]|uniref:uncharacterized protein LOC128546065 n=1 Tax=Mercenaria mercenaria TaxID=6596 RepID=UPI00234F44FB|nr:uncharacterized protein LOC128546065 [Mercenaria mercenaria]